MPWGCESHHGTLLGHLLSLLDWPAATIKRKSLRARSILISKDGHGCLLVGFKLLSLVAKFVVLNLQGIDLAQKVCVVLFHGLVQLHELGSKVVGTAGGHPRVPSGWSRRPS